MTNTSTRNPILWGAYLACSWTWCIGMFLPAILLRDMGWSGFLIFAIPNVFGAAAMGWVIKSRLESVRFVEKYPSAVWWFSAITLAFHFFWILWLSNFIRIAFQVPNPYLYGVFGVFFAFILLSGKMIRMGRAPHLALGLLIVSVSVLISTFCSSEMMGLNSVPFDSISHSIAPLWMLPVMVFGFVLCPYLDITFHHARQQLDTRNNGRVGFSIGFIGFFALMILLTTRYAGVIVDALNGASVAPFASPWIAVGIMIHILCQWGFTVWVHLDRIRTLSVNVSRQLLLVIMVLLSGVIGFFAIKFPSHAGLSGGEIIYRGFLSAYGLVFPAYMLYRVIVGRRKNSPVSLSMMWLAIGLASPMFWFGFVERQPIWLVPGMIIVVSGALILFIKQSRSRPSEKT